MEPTSLFVIYFLSASLLWLLASAVNPTIHAIANVGTALPAGRRFAALTVSAVLLLGIVRIGAATGIVGPPSERLVQMVADGPAPNPNYEMKYAQPVVALLAGNSRTDVHTVQSGESLWRIARQILVTNGEQTSGTAISDLWRSIYEANRSLIGNDPNLIHPGQILQLPTR